jgi:hypothetical protein
MWISHLDFSSVGVVKSSQGYRSMITENWSRFESQYCPCGGCGWAEVDIGVWKKCVVHWDGQLNPDQQLQQKQIEQEIRVSRQVIKDCQAQIRQEEDRILQLQLQRINQTPTKRTMQYSIIDTRTKP